MSIDEKSTGAYWWNDQVFDIRKYSLALSPYRTSQPAEKFRWNLNDAVDSGRRYYEGGGNLVRP
jgi:hypothetical protein